jgi:hypothetical protein
VPRQGITQCKDARYTFEATARAEVTARGRATIQMMVATAFQSVSRHNKQWYSWTYSEQLRCMLLTFASAVVWSMRTIHSIALTIEKKSTGVLSSMYIPFASRTAVCSWLTEMLEQHCADARNTRV